MIDAQKTLSLILAHPDSQSFCRALWQGLTRGAEKNPQYQVRPRHLEALKFSPTMDEGEYLRGTALDDTTLGLERDLAESSDLALVFPLWWGLPPASLSGYLQRAFRGERAWTVREDPWGQRRIEGLRQDLRIHLFITCDSKSPVERQDLARIIQFDLAQFSGASLGDVHYFQGVKNWTWKERSKALAEAEAWAQKLC